MKERYELIDIETKRMGIYEMIYVKSMYIDYVYLGAHPEYGCAFCNFGLLSNEHFQ